MTFFRFDIDARSRQVGRLLGRVRRELLKAIVEERAGGLTQQQLAERLETRRAIVNRKLSGEAEITLKELADLAWALNREVTVELRQPDQLAGDNIAPRTSTIGYQPAKIIAPKRSGD